MINSRLQGEWYLVASTSINSEVDFINDEPNPDGVRSWLNGFSDGLLDVADGTSGLVLSISPDGNFTEQVTGKPKINWYDVDGVLQNEVTPFNGTVIDRKRAAYLIPEFIAEWAKPVKGQYGAAVLRCDDGDTKIADSLRLVEDSLIRTVNIVTDELYLERVIIVYQRAETAKPRDR